VSNLWVIERTFDDVRNIMKGGLIKVKCAMVARHLKLLLTE